MPRICVLQENEANQFEHHGIEHRCNSGRHRHYSSRRAHELVKLGDAQWVGRGKRRIRMLRARTWAKTYSRNAAGEVRGVSMQLTDRFAALFIPSRRQERRVKAGAVRTVEVEA
jgi:hypothetical protein